MTDRAEWALIFFLIGVAFGVGATLIYLVMKRLTGD